MLQETLNQLQQTQLVLLSNKTTQEQKLSPVGQCQPNCFPNTALIQTNDTMKAFQFFQSCLVEGIAAQRLVPQSF